MPAITIRSFVIGLVSVVFLLPCTARADARWVQVRTTIVRSAPEFYAPRVAEVSYGQQVLELSTANGWVKVRTSKGEGYLPVSSLSATQIVLSGAAPSRRRADASDVVLAGKGFSKEVEEEFKRSDAGTRFDLVNSIEAKSAVPSKEMQQFIKAGGLKG